MKSFGYSAFKDTKNFGLNNCNLASDKRPLMINCAGKWETDKYFNTFNKDGRLDYYIMYITKGHISIFADDTPILCDAGSLILFPPNKGYHYINDQSVHTEYLWVHFTGSHTESFIKEYGISIFPAVNKMTVDKQLILRFQNIFDAFTEWDKFRDDELSILFERLLLSVGRRINKKNESAQRPLKTSLNYINNCYNSKIPIPELAKMENLSVSRYNTVFKKLMGISPIEYITHLRINNACELLSSTSFSIKEIAGINGYDDPHFFSKVFKKQTGTSPTVYRNGESD